MKLRCLFTYLLCVTLIFGLFGCGNEETSKEETKKSQVRWEVPIDEEGDPDTPFFDLEADGYHITAAVLMEDGVFSALTEKELVQTATAEIEGEQIGQPKGSDFMPEKSTEKFVKGEEGRITALFERAAMIGFSGSIDFLRRLTAQGEQSKEEIDQTSVDKTVEKAFGLQKKGSSYTSVNAYEGLVPSDEYKYGAIMFVPKVAVVTGEYKGKMLTYHYPCVNDDGFLDGIYLMVQSDDAEEIPEW